jgi:hypothetical protein
LLLGLLNNPAWFTTVRRMCAFTRAPSNARMTHMGCLAMLRQITYMTSEIDTRQLSTQEAAVTRFGIQTNLFALFLAMMDADADVVIGRYFSTLTGLRALYTAYADGFVSAVLNLAVAIDDVRERIARTGGFFGSAAALDVRCAAFRRSPWLADRPTGITEVPERACERCGRLPNAAATTAAAVALRKCSRCRRVRYCSQGCQKKAWRTHKVTCVQATAPAAGATSAGRETTTSSTEPL